MLRLESHISKCPGIGCVTTSIYSPIPLAICILLPSTFCCASTSAQSTASFILSSSVEAGVLCRLKAPAQTARLKVAAHLDELLCKSSGAVCKSAALQSQLAKAAVMLLDEGSADTRALAKRILWSMKRLLPAQQFASLRAQHMSGLGACRTLEAFEEGCSLPDAPVRLAQSFAAVVGNAKACIYCQKLHVPMPGDWDSGNIAALKAQGPWDGGGLVGKKLSVGGLPPQHNSSRRAPSRHKTSTQVARAQTADDAGNSFGGALSQPSYIAAGRSR